MITWVLGFWKGLPAPVKKIIGYVGIALLVLLLLRWYSNRAFEQGVSEGRVAGAKDMEKKMQETWKAQEKAIQLKQEDLAKQRDTLQLQAVELTRARSAIKDSLNKIIAQTQTSREQCDVVAASVPVDQLDGAIRAVSDELTKSPPK
jgi:hypothetical protein